MKLFSSLRSRIRHLTYGRKRGANFSLRTTYVSHIYDIFHDYDKLYVVIATSVQMKAVTTKIVFYFTQSRSYLTSMGSEMRLQSRF